MARHASLAEQLGTIKEYVFRPETVEPLQSNWAESPDLITYDREEAVDMSTERRVRIRPSLREITRGLTGVEFTKCAGRVVPVGGDIERAESGAVIRMGKLRFSDGTQTEKAHKLTVDGKVVAFDARLPIGAMIGTTEAQERVMGGAGTGDANASNRHVADTLGVAHKSYRTGGKRRAGKGFSRDESAAMLTDAFANTQVMPPVKKCPPGVACGTSGVADQFVGMRVNATGGGGSMAWGDIGSALADRAAWAAAVAALKDEDKAAIDAAKTANGFGQVGASIGFNTGWSGKRALIAANDNLARAYKKVS